MTAVVFSTVGRQRNALRVWLEGRKLEREGFTPGASYHLKTNKRDRLVLVRTKAGARTVASRRKQQYRSPIIDVANREVSERFREGQKLRITVRRARIIVRAHPAANRDQDRVERIRRRMASGQPLAVHSLFHGGGVLDDAIHRGMARSGVSSRVAVAVEQERAYMDISLDRNPHLFDLDSVLIEGDIADVDLTRAPLADMVIAGLPCTGASLSGRSKNQLAHAEDHADAGAMFFYLLQWIQSADPAVIVLENVTEYASTASMSAIRGVLKRLGYVLRERTVNGLDFGALEDRNRLCAVAVTESLSDSFQLEDLAPVRNKQETLAEVLDDVPADSDCWKEYAYLTAKAERDRQAGKGFRRQLFTPADDRIATLTRRYHKGGTSDPFIQHPTDPDYSRKVTRHEHARIKGIRESYANAPEMSETLGHEVMGQSVIPLAFEPVGEALGKAVKSLPQETQQAIAA